MKLRLAALGAAAMILPASFALGCTEKSTTTTTPVKYNIVSENVTWSMGDTKVGATITRPDDAKKHPAIVFVAGSGPTDRDWNSVLLPGKNGSAALLADELAKDGFVTIRYDKRVSGPYAQENMAVMVGKLTMESHLDELSAAVAQLTARTDVDASRIFVFGNSEGTIHAINYQLTRTPKFAGLILEGVPGRSMTDVIHAQLAAQLTAVPNGTEMLAHFDTTMANFLAGKPYVDDPVLPEGLKVLAQGLYAPINMPFTRELFSTEPAALLAQVNSPVLAIIGKKDIQVDYIADGVPLQAIAKDKTNITIIFPENADHVMKYEAKARESLTAADGANYNADGRVIDPDALMAVKEWLAERIE